MQLNALNVNGSKALYMKKIFIPVLGLTNHGGLRVLCQMANMLVTKGYDVSFLLPKGRMEHVFNIDSRVSLKQIGFETKNKYLAWMLFCLISPFYMRKGLIIANFFITVYPSLLAKIIWRDIDIVYFIQDIEYLFRSGFVRIIAKGLCLFSYKSPKLIPVAANPYLYKKLIEITPRLEVFKLGIDDSFIDTPILNNKKKYDVVYFLRDDLRKRLDRFERLLNYFASDGVKVICISQSTELLEKYRHRVANVAKPKNDLELISYIDSAKVMLLTSEQEGFSLPPLECMARGVVPVLFACGGPEIYAKHGKNSFVIEPDNYDSMRMTINRLLTTSEFNTISEQCIETSKNYRMSLSLDLFEKKFIRGVNEGNSDEIYTDHPNL